MKNLYISEIQLLSKKEKKAKKVIFDRKRTLIHGKNQTGKSSLIKSIYWTFGAEPKFHPTFVDANVSALVKFEINSDNYEIIRDGKLFAIFNEDGELIKKFKSVTKELAPYLGKLFDFTPLFQSQYSGFIVPPPAFLFLPYYIDQDSSWIASWASFKSLQQIKDYRNQSINYHSGIRPNAYYFTKKEIQEYLNIIDETEKELNLTSKILEDVKQNLSQTSFNIDVDAFKTEINELLVESESLLRKEDKLKNRLNELYNLKATYEAQINIVKQAITESNKDLIFLTDTLPEMVGCPTCGAEYENSFSERFEIARDEEKSKELLVELIKEFEDINEKIKSENDELSSTTSEVFRINQILEKKKGNLKLKDVIDNSGKNQVKNLFKERQEYLTEILVENTIKKDKLDKTLKSFDDKDRKKEITDFYRSRFASFLAKLDVHSLSPNKYKSITSKIENIETGSTLPRALIAYYFTFFI